MDVHPLDPHGKETLLSNQSLRELFADLIRRNFGESLRLSDSEITAYLANLLADFNRSENLYRIRDARGKPLEDVGEMLIASNPLLDCPSFDRERAIRKHIGDFTLFFTGLFPEAIQRWRLRRQSINSFLDFVKAGKESYFIVSEFNQAEYKSSAPFFRKMADAFETCVFGLNLVKRDLERMQHASHIGAQGMFS